MNELGRKLYYQPSTGNVVFTRGEMTGHVIESTKEQDFASYSKLADYNPNTIGVVQLEHGQYAEEFAACNGYRVNPGTGEIQFLYPDLNDPEEPPTFRKPLSIEVDELRQENILLKVQNAALSERADFVEDVIAEMVKQVYQ
ncbi:hypothetical protein JCM10914A_10200 [Paenibacillus sp. JCM 10914]|uniref:hypothetical protein n=1 Tax=Paenibacillus sp. JCM 10914 TaxID=1236974 RepID=UPI0003CC4D75|nr:hypothetical protein [Paenibacillus sp. JCM 10914]GAE07287.1 hypothetical protein JCM10914_3507 [Paenibacillus sp. JCM 10914]